MSSSVKGQILVCTNKAKGLESASPVNNLHVIYISCLFQNPGYGEVEDY